jgi:predicted amidophosphoribosyltransferase
MRRWTARTIGALTDLVLPSACAGCGASGSGQLCDDCADGLAALTPQAAEPSPAPVGLPPCVALGAYEGPMRGLLIAYKDRGAHRLAGSLGDQLGRVVGAALHGMGTPVGTPVVLVPVPDTAAARRDRHGDHMARLARRAARAVRHAGWPVALGHAVSALPKADSSHLSAEARAVSAFQAFRVRPSGAQGLHTAATAGARIVVLDDILTTGSTVAAVAAVLGRSGVPVHAAATLAATRRRRKSSDRAAESLRPPTWAFPTNRGPQ